jgi:hypothetical protein
MNGGPAQEPWAALLSPILWTGWSRPPWWSCWDVTLLRTLTRMILESRVLLMAKLTPAERERRRKQYAGRWMPSRTFPAKRAGQCIPCGEVIPEGSPAIFRFYEGAGAGHFCHPACLDVAGVTVGAS